MQKIVIHGVFGGNGVPVYASEHASGADITASLETPVVISPGKRALIPTGIRLELPEGYEAQVRPRSGLALNNGVTVLNTPGTIDADYRGEIKIILINNGEDPFRISDGDRIAQIVFAPVIRAEFIPFKELPDTDRGAGGFGSTGM